MKEEKEELLIFELDLEGGRVEIQIPSSKRDDFEKIIKDENFKGTIQDSKISIIPSKDSDLNDIQYAWKDFNKSPSIISLSFNIKESNIWKVLNNTFEFYDSDIIKKSEMILSDDNKIIENSRYFIKLENGLFISFVSIDDNSEDITIYGLTITYNSIIHKHDDLADYFLQIFEEYIIFNKKTKEGNFFITNYDNEGFYFEPYKLENIKLDLKGKKKETYKEILKGLNSEERGISILYGDKESGKTTYLKKLIKNLSKKIIYVPVDNFEYVFSDKTFFSDLEQFGNCLIILEDCELFFRNNSSTNIYLSIINRFNDSLINKKSNFSFLLVFNVYNLNFVCSDIKKSSKINHISMVDDIVKFNGYK